MTERITGVALLTAEGELWSLPKPNRHCNLFALAAFQGNHADPCTQGFTTDIGRFVGREEAVGIATEARQLIRKTDPPSQLFSEDLW
ncbi:hypothetical protein ACWIGM_08760 [Bosea sp. NPDC055332]